MAYAHFNHAYPEMKKSYSYADGTTFNLSVEAGSFSDSEIVVLLGQNGTGM